jgi:hypothetical protein
LSNHPFKLQINFTTSYVDQDANHCLEAVASGPEVDLTDERMSPEALKPMVASIALPQTPQKASQAHARQTSQHS